MKEYKISKNIAIINTIFITIFICGLFWFNIQKIQQHEFSYINILILFPASIIIFILLIISIIDSFKSKFIILNDRLKSTSTISNKELKFEDIAGFTINDIEIIVVPKNSKKKSIKISAYLSGFIKIKEWIYNNFPNLETQYALNEEKIYLNDYTNGSTSNERKSKLKIARKVAWLINWSAIISSLWTIIYPYPYDYSFFLTISVTIIAIIAIKFSNGLIGINRIRGSAFPSVTYAFLFNSVAIGSRVVSDFEIYDYSNSWSLPTIITLISILILLVNQKEFTFSKLFDYLTVTFLAIFLFVYSFGIVIFINCYYDNTKPEIFNSKVLKKNKYNKYSKYSILIAKWDKKSKNENINISKELYDNINIGDDVKICLRKGKLEIPWFCLSHDK